MDKKKGFTLVELLAVISIMALLVIMAMPKIIDIYNNTKKRSFINEVNSLLNAAKSTYVNESIKDNWISEIVSHNFVGAEGATDME